MAQAGRPPSAAAAGVGIGALADTINLDLRGSITLSPTRQSAQAHAPSTAAQPPSTAGLSGQAPGPLTSITGTLRVSGTGPALPYSYQGPGAVPGGRPSSSGMGGGPGLVVKAAGVGSTAPQSAPGGAAAGSAADPLVRETAQSFYQRPQVLVTRGPAAGGGSAAGAAGGMEAPRPRGGAPLPTVRML